MCPSSDAAHEILSLKLIEVASGSFEPRGLGANLESLVGFFKKGQASQAGGRESSCSGNSPSRKVGRG